MKLHLLSDLHFEVLKYRSPGVYAVVFDKPQLAPYKIEVKIK